MFHGKRHPAAFRSINGTNTFTGVWRVRILPVGMSLFMSIAGLGAMGVGMWLQWGPGPALLFSGGVLFVAGGLMGRTR